MSLRWYVIQVATNMEDIVQDSIVKSLLLKLSQYSHNADYMQLNALKQSFGVPVDIIEMHEIESFLKLNAVVVPKEKVEEIRNGKKRETERKIFPGYILLNMEYTDELGLLIRKTKKVSGFVGVGKDAKPVPVSQREVDSILNQIEQTKEKAKHKVEFDIGEKIHIIDGPFVDFNATIEEVIYPKSKLKVNVQIFGRETAVELDFAQVQKIT